MHTEPTQKTTRALSRRSFIQATVAAGAGLNLGFYLPAAAADKLATDGPHSSAIDINAWIRITPDNQVICEVARAEMGQGTSTSLPMMLAEELECRWDDVRSETTLMRIKESAHDYRYFPDPDLLPVKTSALVEAARLRKPELPWEKRARFVADFGVSDYDASVLANDLALASYFETAARGAKKPKNIANWILNDLLSSMSASSIGISECPVAPAALDDLVNLIDSGTINSKQGKEVFAEMFQTGKSAATIVEEKGLKQVSDTGAIEGFVDEVITANPGPVADYKAGKVSALNFLKGQVMKLSKGKANPALAGEILEKKMQ